MSSFARRVAVFEPTVDRAQYIGAVEAARLIGLGVAVVRQVTASCVIEITRLEAARVQIDARPGSFGIRREHLPVGNQYGLSGGVVFSHHSLRLAA